MTTTNTSARERPILFSAPMVRAILDGTKTQTRRVVKPQPEWIHEVRGAREDGGFMWPIGALGQQCGAPVTRLLYGKPGDRLWVRETWGAGSRPDPWGGYEGIEYRADEAWLEEGDDLSCYKVETPDDVCLCDIRSGWHPSIHMPRWACRIVLEVTGVRVERLQAISAGDCIAEGLSTNLRDHDAVTHLRDQFRELWISTGGDWEANPWVWVVEFKRLDTSARRGEG